MHIDSCRFLVGNNSRNCIAKYIGVVNMVSKVLVRGLSLSSILFMSYSHATANLVDVAITHLHINKSLGNFLFIRTSIPPAIIGCQIDNNWNLVLPLETELDNKIYAGLLAAQASQSKVDLQGSGSCSSWGIEYLNRFSIKK